MRWTGGMITIAITAMIVTLPTIGASWNKALQRVAGVLIGVVLGIVILVVVEANTDDVFWILLAAWAGGSIAGWVMAGPWETSYVGVQVGIALCLVMGSAAPSANLDGPLERVTGILIGVIIAIVIMRVLWPVWARRQVCASLSEAAQLLASMLEVGLRSPQEEANLRPKNGWSYAVSWAISEASRYREEARYERGLAPSRSSPILTLSTLLYDALPRVILIVQYRLEYRHDQVNGSLSELVAFRESIERRLHQIASLVMGANVQIEDLEHHRRRAHEVLSDEVSDLSPQDQRAQLQIMGFYHELIPVIDEMVPAAREAAQMFLHQGEKLPSAG